MRIPHYIKSPEATLDWTFDWNVQDDPDEIPWLKENETITDYSITVDAVGLTILNVYQDNGKIIVWITGGVIGKTYLLSCKITTSSAPARIDERSILIKIVQR